MTPDQALQLLEQCAAAANTTRQGHIQLMQALEVFKKLIPVEEKKAE